MKVRVYGITTGRRPPSVGGVQLSLVRIGVLAAIVSTARTVRPPTDGNLRRYHQIVSAIAPQLPAFLPARFETVLDDAELMMVLRHRGDQYAEALRHVRGAVQMTIRLVEDRLHGGGDREPPPPVTSGRSYLRDRAMREKNVPGFAPVRQAVLPWIRDERVERAAGVTTVYHLVPRRAAAAYRRAGTAAIASTGLRAVMTGPFPPYAFSGV